MKIERFTRLGFILAASGSAVGLGNIWKFPYIAGEYGGGAFVIMYLLTVLVIGFSIMIAEMFIGYEGRSDGVTCFENLDHAKPSIWRFGGFMGLSGLFVMIFYSVVIGWIFNYIVIALTSLPANVTEAERVFNTMLNTDIVTQLFYHTIAFIIITYVLLKGIKGGIEKLNYVLMPLLMLIIGGMFLYATTLDSFGAAVDFMFKADFSKINSEAFVVAVGHAFFTLSLGMGAILTYSASLPKGSNLIKSSLYVVAIDTAIALAAGLMLFTFLFQYGAEPAKGPGLVFISLPAIFYEMGIIGNFFAVIFFVALAFAGLTSAVSLTEPMVQYFISRWNFSRLKAALSMGLFFYLVGIVALLSNIDTYESSLTFFGNNFFDLVDFVTAAIMLPLGGLIMSIFVGFVVEKQRVEKVLKEPLGKFFELWYFSIRYVAPTALSIVALNLFGII
ncbi:MAG: sodium-dependent transporter [Helicobacteraceae bacterium]|nr:sodium-dependent transporter [Helicobacteraceae bacterium]